MQLMVEDDKLQFFVPSELGYGDEEVTVRGVTVPAGSALVFTAEIKRIGGDVTATKPVRRCDPNPPHDGCFDREVQFLTDVFTWNVEKKNSELKRLFQVSQVDFQKLSTQEMHWARRRFDLMRRLADPDGKLERMEEEMRREERRKRDAELAQTGNWHGW